MHEGTISRVTIAPSFIQDLLSRADIVDIVGRYVPLKKGGANFMGLCPFHGEKSPSFSVSPAKQFYHCFGCGKTGNAIGFLMEHTGMGFVEAVHDLAQQYGLQVPDDETTSPLERARAAQQRARQTTMTDVLEKAAPADQIGVAVSVQVGEDRVGLRGVAKLVGRVRALSRVQPVDGARCSRALDEHPRHRLLGVPEPVCLVVAAAGDKVEIPVPVDISERRVGGAYDATKRVGGAGTLDPKVHADVFDVPEGCTRPAGLSYDEVRVPIAVDVAERRRKEFGPLDPVERVQLPPERLEGPVAGSFPPEIGQVPVTPDDEVAVAVAICIAKGQLRHAVQGIAVSEGDAFYE